MGMLSSMATVLSIASQKGGTGKSSTAINIACALEGAKYRIAVIDADPQATFTKWFRKRRKNKATGFNVLTVASGLLEEEIATLRQDPDLDIIVVDCPGNIEEISRKAVKSSDAVLSPLRPSSVDIEHTVDTARFIREMRLSYPELKFMLFINSAMPRWNLSRDAAKTTREILSNLENTYVLEAQIPLAVAIAEFFGTGLSIYEYAPKSSAAVAYKKLAKEVIECLVKN